MAEKPPLSPLPTSGGTRWTPFVFFLLLLPRYCKFDAITQMADMYSLPYTGVIDRPDLQVRPRGRSACVLGDATGDCCQGSPFSVSGGVRSGGS